MQTIHDPILNLCGDKIALGPLRADLTPAYEAWMNDFAIAGLASGEVMPRTPEKAQEFYQDSTHSRQDKVFAIYLPIDGDTGTAHEWRAIGTAGLHQIDHINRTAEFGIIIGERDCWNNGYGTETTRLLLDYGFNAAGLNNIMLRCAADNLAGIKAYERAGFKRIGVMHACRWEDGRMTDMILMDCLAGEFGASAVLQQLTKQVRP